MNKAYEFDFVYDTQAAFRLLLEALSNPGRIVELGPLTQETGWSLCHAADCGGSAFGQ